MGANENQPARGGFAMTKFESAITRAESDLAQVQSALDTAQQVLDVADRAQGTGRRLFKLIRIVAVVLAIAGVAVTAAVLIDRFSGSSDPEQLDGAADATPLDQIRDN
jgi:hypothetical protein